MWISKEIIQVALYVAVFVVGIIIGFSVANRINRMDHEH